MEEEEQSGQMELKKAKLGVKIENLKLETGVTKIEAEEVIQVPEMKGVVDEDNEMGENSNTLFEHFK